MLLILNNRLLPLSSFAPPPTPPPTPPTPPPTPPPPPPRARDPLDCYYTNVTCKLVSKISQPNSFDPRVEPCGRYNANEAECNRSWWEPNGNSAAPLARACRWEGDRCINREVTVGHSAAGCPEEPCFPLSMGNKDGMGLPLRSDGVRGDVRP